MSRFPYDEAALIAWDGYPFQSNGYAKHLALLTA